MATLISNTLILNSGKQIKLMGDAICIGETLEVGEGYSSRILFYDGDHALHPGIDAVCNSYNLTAEDMFELLDYIIKMCSQLKANIGKYGIGDPAIFNRSNEA